MNRGMETVLVLVQVQRYRRGNTTCKHKPRDADFACRCCSFRPPLILPLPKFPHDVWSSVCVTTIGYAYEEKTLPRWTDESRELWLGKRQWAWNRATWNIAGALFFVGMYKYRSGNLPFILCHQTISIEPLCMWLCTEHLYCRIHFFTTRTINSVILELTESTRPTPTLPSLTVSY